MLSAVLAGLSVLLLFLAFFAGNYLFGGGAVLLFALSRFARKTESYDGYRARYDEKYGISEQDEDENSKDRTTP